MKNKNHGMKQSKTEYVLRMMRAITEAPRTTSDTKIKVISAYVSSLLIDTYVHCTSIRLAASNRNRGTR